MNTIAWIVVIAAVAAVLIGLVAWLLKEQRDRRHAHAEAMRRNAAAGATGIPDAEVRAREADLRAEQAQLQSERATDEAEQARLAVSQEQAVYEDQMREADRLDPTVDHEAGEPTPGDTADEPTKQPRDSQG